jgi:hypothetical protein
MEVNTYKGFTDLIQTRQLDSDVNYNFSRALTTLEGIISEDEVKHFYVKKPFSDEQDTEVIILLQEKILLLNVTNDSTNITSLNLDKIEKVELNINETGNREVILTLHWQNNSTLEFNSLDDSNIHWNYRYVEDLKELFKFLNNL